MSTDTTRPAESEVRGYIGRFCNWGRWGDDDQLGTINFISDAVRVDASRLISLGVAVSCSREIATGPSVEDAPGSSFPQRRMLSTGEELDDPARIASPGSTADGGLTTAAEFVGYEAHGYRLTHLDGLSHAFWGRRMFNGVAAERVNSHQGAGWHGIENFRDGIVTRGLLVDIPRFRGVRWLESGDGVSGDELCAVLAAQAVEVRTGDALLLRTGYGRKRRERGGDSPEVGSAGWEASCLPHMYEWQIAICGADVAQDIRPSPYKEMRSPVHSVGLTAMGMPLLDNADLERLAAQCEAANRWEFFLSIAPLAVVGATSSAVNPIAIF